MLMNPPILFADEPTSALDVSVQLQVVKEMLKLRELFGTAIVFVTHDIGVVRAMADTVLVLKQLADCAHAAVAETVALVKHYGHANDRTVAFANAVLRNAANAAQNGSLPRLNCPEKESYYALQYSHPEWRVRLRSEQYGQKLTQKICQADNADAPISVRVNTMKCTPAEAQAELEAAGLTVQPHEAFPEILLSSGGDAAALPAFIEGRVTVQDAASALAAAVADPKPGSTVLDCCAAPGGKSFAMAEKMQGKGSVTSCDIYEHKLKRIRDGAARLGLSNIRTELQDASVCREEWKDSADVVLCDVPCSGLGIIRKKPEIRFKNPDEIRT